ncbi:MAG: leucyl/phenylalanyl-tRNA--protein transferase [Bacteroidetes bacterium]|nr:MAG: leucyl/phenylalanyl-tRNA--protein transferase [Bacteroidota bacterium]
MPVYLLNESPLMPDPIHADAEGLVAIGGDLAHKRLINAYKSGIFPWYEEGSEILWWSPDPRLVLFPEELKVSKSMRSLFRKNYFNVTVNQQFVEVIANCKNIDRTDQGGTWITDEMEKAYISLHKLGYAHSVEVWHENKLVGGLYGIKLGNIYFGESMYSKVSNASKIGFIHLVKDLSEKGVKMIDCQIKTDHLISLGAREISRQHFLKILKRKFNST